VKSSYIFTLPGRKFVIGFLNVLVGFISYVTLFLLSFPSLHFNPLSQNVFLTRSLQV
jgi:hypothetical protein